MNGWVLVALVVGALFTTAVVFFASFRVPQWRVMERSTFLPDLMARLSKGASISAVVSFHGKVTTLLDEVGLEFVTVTERLESRLSFLAVTGRPATSSRVLDEQRR